jgi:hypothetical protein
MTKLAAQTVRYTVKDLWGGVVRVTKWKQDGSPGVTGRKFTVRDK